MTHHFPTPSSPSPNHRNDYISSWRTWMRAQSWSERTILDREFLIRRVAREFECPPEQLDEDHVLAFLSQSSFSSTSRQTYWQGLKAWFDFLVLKEIRDESPMVNVRKPKAGKRRPKYISTAHLVHLLDSRMQSRTRTMILLGAYQGLRVHEIAKIKGSDIDLISKELHVHGKGDVEEVLPLHPLIEEQAARYGQGWWFPQRGPHREAKSGGHMLGASVTSIVGTAMKRAGIPGSAHSLRHWYATELLRSGVDSRVTQELMRHASLATTQLYMHVDDTQRRDGLLRLPDATCPAVEQAAVDQMDLGAAA